jgi:hypothetical protein
MPFQSKAQARFMFAKHPGIAKEFASHTKSIKGLPEHKRNALHDRAVAMTHHRKKKRFFA